MRGIVDLVPSNLRRVAVLAAFCLAATVMALGLAKPVPADAAVPSSATIGFAVDPSSSTYAVGSSPRFHVRLTNLSLSACALAAIGDLTVSVVGATRDGSPVVPSYVRSLPIDGAAAGVARRTSSVPAGGSVTFDVNTLDRALPASIGLDDGSMLVGLYPLTEPGRYQLLLSYAMPPAAFATDTVSAGGDAACAGTSDPVSVVFTVGSPGSGVLWWLIAAVVGLVVLAGVVVLLFWIRARKRRGGGGGVATIATAAALVLLASIGGVAIDVINPALAHAGVIYGPDPSADPAIYKTYTDCLGKIAAFDPGLMQALNPVNVLVLPIPGGDPQTVPSKTGGPHDSTISWDPEKGTGFKGETSGAVYDPCMGLYHELNHARDRATDSDSSQECDDTGVLVDEVRATVAENRFRAAQKPPLPPRTTYDGKKIPPTLDGCTPPKKKKDERVASNDPGTCRGIDGPCGSHTGDPHIGTFDGYRFDLQAVGEFVAVHSAGGDMDIQVRQSPFPGSRTVAVNTAVAMRVAGVRVGFYLEHNTVVVHRDGAAVDIPIGTSSLGASGAKINHIVDPGRGHSFAVVWPDGSAVWVAQASVWGLSLNVQPRLARTGTLTGLLGPFDGDRTDDVSTVDGRKLSQPPPFDDLYHTYAPGWRVTETNSLFDYAAGKSTKDFTDSTFPDKPVAADSLPAAQRDSASAACTLLGVIDPISLAECIVDVATTGQAIFAVSAERAQTAAGLGNVGGTGGGAAGPTQTLTITAPGGTASMSFDATARQRAYVQVTATTLPNGCGVPVLVAPNGTPISIGCLSDGKGFVDGTLLSTTGRYQVLVRPGNGATGTITMRVILSADVTAPIVPDGPAASQTVTAAGQQARLTFTATAGMKVFVDIPGTTSLPASCGTVYLAAVNPSGDLGPTVSLGCLATDGTGFIDTTTLATAGIYAVVLDPPADGTGAATVKVTTVHDQQLTIIPDGSPVNGAVMQAGAKSLLTFNATAGEEVFVDVLSTTSLPGACGTIYLAVVNPSGDPGPTVSLGCTATDGTGFIDTTTLATAGTYAVVVDPPARGVGSASMKLSVVHDQQQAIVLNGPSVTATVPQAGARSFLTFSGTAGQTVTIDGTGASAPLAGCGSIALRGPNGATIDLGCVKADGTMSIGPDTLPTTGTYTIAVDPSARNTGAVQLRAHT